MAVQLINIGNVANDGTGDDLREAMIKINSNFEELDLRDDEQTTVSNLGNTGEGVFAQKLNYDLKFKKIAAGTNVTLTADDNKITIAADSGVSDLTVTADTGSVVLDNSAALTIAGGADINTSVVDNTLTIAYTGITDLVSDLTPQLGADLDAQAFNLLNVGTITSTGISAPVTGNVLGNLTGLVHGYDIRDWAQWNTGFDFGAVSEDYSSIIEFIVAQTDVDFGAFGAPAVGNVDLGSI